MKPHAKVQELSKMNSYCKKNYGKGEVNVVGITQVRLRKIKNVAMASFHCLVGKICKKNSTLCCYRKGKNARFVLFLKRKKLI